MKATTLGHVRSLGGLAGAQLHVSIVTKRHGSMSFTATLVPRQYGKLSEELAEAAGLFAGLAAAAAAERRPRRPRRRRQHTAPPKGAGK